jgi:hypothetical protein
LADDHHITVLQRAGDAGLENCVIDCHRVGAAEIDHHDMIPIPADDGVVARHQSIQENQVVVGVSTDGELCVGQLVSAPNFWASLSDQEGRHSDLLIVRAYDDHLARARSHD